MESSLTESTQQLVRPGKCTDVYYPDPQTANKQCWRTSTNTRYVQDFTNKGGGSSTFTISPNNGVQDVALILTLPAASSFPTGNSTKLGVCRGWGYASIKQISFRYAGSSQYFLSGQQVLQAALAQCTDSGSRDAILSLGGDALTNDGANDGFASQKSAYVWLPLPHCVPSSAGKLPPLPSDLLTQQIQVTVELYPLATIFSIAAGGSTANVPREFALAKFQVQQVLLENQGDALARRVDMTSNALSYPIIFRQQENTVVVNGGVAYTQPGPTAAVPVQTVALNGFRSGEVKEIHCWLSADAQTPTPGPATAQAPFAWYPLNNAVMSYGGEVYARYDENSGQLWNLVNGRIPAQVNDVLPVASGPVITFSSPTADAWTVLPFGQAYDSATAHSMYMAGKPITNGIVNLSFTIPRNAPSNSSYTLHVTYVYNAVLTFSQGTCDYAF